MTVKHALLQEGLGLVNAMRYAASPTAYTSTTLAAAVAAVGSTPATIYLEPATWSITSTVTLPVACVLAPAAGTILNLSGGVVLTLGGGIEVADTQRQLFSGTGAVVFSAPLLSPVRPQWWGATGNGVTDDRAAIQAALNASLTVYFPPGTYLVAGVASQVTDGLQLRTGHQVYGAGWTSILQQGATCQYIMSVNQYDGGTTDVADNARNIHIHDLQLSSSVATLGFSEHFHQLNVNAVSDLLVERCHFYGMRGDGIYVGSGNLAATERHNERVTIRQCLFDGIVKDNRNGVSIIDCDTALIDDCTFTRISRSNMPGAVDLEPDTNAFSILKNITCRHNTIYDTASNGFALVWRAATVPHEHFVFDGNSIENPTDMDAFAFLVTSGEDVAAGNYRQNITIAHNSTKNIRPFFTGSCDGLFIHHNMFSDSSKNGYLSNDVLLTRNVWLTDNCFQRLGTTTGATGSLQLGVCDDVVIERNSFITCGEAGGGTSYAIYFLAGKTSNRILINRNLFTSIVAGFFDVYLEPTHTTTLPSNTFYDNQHVSVGRSTTYHPYHTTTYGGDNTYDTTINPAAFTEGVSVSVVNGDAALPSAVGSKQGILRTEVYVAPGDAARRKFIVQWFYPAQNAAASLVDIWWRKAATNGSDAWSAWQRVSGTPTAQAVYTPTNVTQVRSYNANATSTDELADVLGTLIADLQAAQILA